MTNEEAIRHIKTSCYLVGYPSHDKEYETRKCINEALDMAIKALEQSTNDCKIFGTKENCFGGATENECNHCDYKIQALEQQSYEDEVQKVVDYLLSPKSKSTSKNCVVEDLLKEVSEQKRWLSDVGYNVYSVDVAFESIVRVIQNITPTHRMCKDCTKSKILNGFEGYSIVCSRFGRMAVNPDFYCADFEKRGNSDGSN